MTKYIIAFQITNPNSSRDKLVKAIRQHESFARINSNTYIIESKSNPVELRDWLGGYMYSGDKIYVGAITRPAAWAGMEDDVSDWLKQKI